MTSLRAWLRDLSYLAAAVAGFALGVVDRLLGRS